ncbi:DUF1801 domain-containing protein [Spongiimicrobium sp. 3-5]|uniref:DUF1801 domain-containing protein n=1 Tax=Spongiimicrobium sp. 3-5 TaxID=3332596 RepID=UPI00397E9340
MRSNATTPEAYIEELPEDRKPAIRKLRKTILENLPTGFNETMNYGMIGYVIPHSLYPNGYHCDPKLPLPFMNLASQKNYIAVYHMGVYSDKTLLAWFTKAYAKHTTSKLDMGKSCIRFKNIKAIPFALIGELCTKITPKEWIILYEKATKNN